MPNKMTMVISWDTCSADTSDPREHYGYAAYHLFESHRKGIMFKRLRLQVNRAVENAERTSEFGLHSDLRVELAGYWSRLLVSVKERSEAVRAKEMSQE